MFIYEINKGCIWKMCSFTRPILKFKEKNKKTKENKFLNSSQFHDKRIRDMIFLFNSRYI